MLNFIKKKILIYGFGKCGKSAYKKLNKNNTIFIFDDSPKFIHKKFHGKILKKYQIKKINFDYIILSPGVNIKKCSLKKFLKINISKIITDFDIFYLFHKDNLKIAITGTNGKSTTAKLIYDVIRNKGKDVRLVGNIGNPILDEKRIKKETIFIIEASSYQLEYSKYFKADIAVILNISPDHIERHQSFSNYVFAKFKLIINQATDGVAIIEKNNDILEKQLRKYKIKTKVFRVKKFNKKLVNKISNNYFKNYNNLDNLKFVLKIVDILKINRKFLFDSINKFNELPFRQQIIFKNTLTTIVNDSKSTSFSSSINLLKSHKNIYWILGGLFKKNDRFKLEKKYYKNIKGYVFGKDKNIFSKKLKNKIKLKLYDNLKDILYDIFKLIKNDYNKKIIIFSPAAASFDQFKNFEERGKYFNRLVYNFLKNN